MSNILLAHPETPQAHCHAVIRAVLPMSGLNLPGGSRPLSEARAVLEAAGLAVEVKGVPCGPSGYCKTGPIKTVPQAGSVLPRGSTAFLYVRGYGAQP